MHNYYYPENLSSDAIDLIEHLLKINPNERFNFDEIKAHPWFNLIYPKLYPGLQTLVHKIPLDNKILEKANNMGYDIQKIEDSVIKNKFDSFNAIYYLILKQLKRKGYDSVSDLSSEKFINFLKDYKNWIDISKINDPLYKNYEMELPKDYYNNYISVNIMEKFDDIEEKNYEKYINNDKMINDMEIKFDNINILDSFDDCSEEKDIKKIGKNKKIISERNKNSNDFIYMNSKSDYENSKNTRENEMKKYNNTNSNIRIQVNKRQKEKIIK